MNDSTLTANRREIKEKIITLAKSVMQQKTIFIMSIITFVLSCIFICFICTKNRVFLHSACGLMFAMLCLLPVILFTQNLSFKKKYFIQGHLLSGTNSIISETEHCRIRQKSSNFVVVMPFPFLIRSMVALLMLW